MSVWKKLVWIGVAALGTWSVAILALSRGEKISALWIVIAGFCALSISYRFYSKWLATKVLVLNEERATPAVLRNDNKDYVPTNRWMVFRPSLSPRSPDPDRWLAPCWLRSLVFYLALSGS